MFNNLKTKLTLTSKQTFSHLLSKNSFSDVWIMGTCLKLRKKCDELVLDRLCMKKCAWICDIGTISMSDKIINRILKGQNIYHQSTMLQSSFQVVWHGKIQSHWLT